MFSICHFLFTSVIARIDELIRHAMKANKKLQFSTFDVDLEGRISDTFFAFSNLKQTKSEFVSKVFLNKRKRNTYDSRQKSYIKPTLSKSFVSPKLSFSLSVSQRAKTFGIKFLKSEKLKRNHPTIIVSKDISFAWDMY